MPDTCNTPSRSFLYHLHHARRTLTPVSIGIKARLEQVSACLLHLLVSAILLCAFQVPIYQHVGHFAVCTVNIYWFRPFYCVHFRCLLPACWPFCRVYSKYLLVSAILLVGVYWVRPYCCMYIRPHCSLVGR